MKVPLSWLKDFVDISIPVEELAHTLTMAGLEVEEIQFVGLPMPSSGVQDASDQHKRQETKITGVEWDPEKIVVGAILEVMPHPNADRLVLCRLDDGQQEHTVLTGAPNLFDFKGTGSLDKPLRVAYAREGARIYDGHKPGKVLMTLKRAKIRGIESYSMACSEKELGISDEHKGIIFLDDAAPTGMPLADYMGDAVLDITLTPNVARAASILGVAREVAALTSQKIKLPSTDVLMEAEPIDSFVDIDILNPQLNPRFVLGLIKNIEIKQSPYEIQRRLRLAGIRPINNVVDATNFAMLEIGEPLHAFDYDALVSRAKGKMPIIITRTAQEGERLTTLDEVDRQLDDYTVLVCDQAGSLSIAGVMGGAETEVNHSTTNVLLEGAAWNFINIRRTISSQRMNSEAAYRFSRGVHPSIAKDGVLRGLKLMHKWAGGKVCQGVKDNYPLPPDDPTIEITPDDVTRWLGVQLDVNQIAAILKRLDFSISIKGQAIQATTPDHRLDIGEGITGKADLMEEIARIYGYENIPETRMADSLPPQKGNPGLDLEEHIRDVLVNLGLQEVVTYRMTSPENEARRLPPDIKHVDRPYVRLKNYIVNDRVVMRQSLLASVLEIMEHNSNLRERMAFFEIGPEFLVSEDSVLPDEISHLVIALTGPSSLPSWKSANTSPMDFFDLKGITNALFKALHLDNVQHQPGQCSSFHPGKCAKLLLGKEQIGLMGVLHPQVQEQYDLPETAIVAADIDMDVLLKAVPQTHHLKPIPEFPPVLEDIAVVVDDNLPAEKVVEVIYKSGGKTVSYVRLFDVYRGEQIGKGKKSLAYRLTYQAYDRTLTDKQVAKIRKRIVASLKKELNASLRG